MSLVLHLTADLALAAHLVSLLLLLLLLSSNGLLHDLLVLFFADFLTSRVNAPHSANLEGNGLRLKFLQEPMNLRFLSLFSGGEGVRFESIKVCLSCSRHHDG